MKKIIALCTAFTLLILACCVVPISSAQEVISDSETLQPTYTNKLNKIHFYFATENETDKSVVTMSTPEKVADYHVAIYQKSDMLSQITSEIVGLSMCIK